MGRHMAMTPGPAQEQQSDGILTELRMGWGQKVNTETQRNKNDEGESTLVP